MLVFAFAFGCGLSFHFFLLSISFNCFSFRKARAKIIVFLFFIHCFLTDRMRYTTMWMKRSCITIQVSWHVIVKTISFRIHKRKKKWKEVQKCFEDILWFCAVLPSLFFASKQLPVWIDRCVDNPFNFQANETRFLKMRTAQYVWS